MRLLEVSSINVRMVALCENGGNLLTLFNDNKCRNVCPTTVNVATKVDKRNERVMSRCKAGIPKKGMHMRVLENNHK